jgi:nucleoside-diphosphate-sugar epimerase
MALPIVLLTGASGKIGAGFRDDYLERHSGSYRLRLGAHRPGFTDGRFDEIVPADITDLDQMTRACDGVDTVVHLAASADWEGDFCSEQLKPNIIGAYHVFEAARRAGCRRVVYASSVHAIMGYPLDFQAHATDPSRPDTMYGVTKVFGEGLCSSFHYLYGMSCIAIRIGAYVPDDERQKVTYSANPQLLDIVISQRDMSQLLHLCITAPQDVGFAIVNGVSHNRYKRMDVERGRELLGYHPQDDSFEWSVAVELGPEKKV